MTAFAHRHGTGSLRRRHVLVAVDEHTVRAGMEDEMHHFELVVHHDGSVVTDVTGTPVRWPWAPCFESPSSLRALAGLALDARPAEIAAWTDVRQHCTHQFDLATLAMAHAARHVRGGAARRDYRTEVPDWYEPPVVGRLWRDDELLLEWTCSYDVVLEPEAYRGLPTRQGFFAWCEANLDAELTEAAQMLRRAVWMSPARKLDLEAFADAEASGIKHDICYTSQPERLPLAIRNKGSLRDFSTSSEPLLRDW